MCLKIAKNRLKILLVQGHHRTKQGHPSTQSDLSLDLAK
jgi:hypothetical protein